MRGQPVADRAPESESESPRPAFARESPSNFAPEENSARFHRATPGDIASRYHATGSAEHESPVNPNLRRNWTRGSVLPQVTRNPPAQRRGAPTLCLSLLHATPDRALGKLP